MRFKRGDVVLVNYPFVTDSGVQQKVRPALVVSDHTTSRRFPDDVILAAITSRHLANIMPNELRIETGAPDFRSTGLKVTSVVRLDFLMTVPAFSIHKRIGKISQCQIRAVDERLKRSLGLRDKG